MLLRFYFSILIIFVSIPTRGNSQESLFRTFDIKYNGTKLILQAIAFDSNGKMLCGTDEGVMFYDGVGFSPAFTHNYSSSQPVQCLYQGSKECMWVGYKNGKIGFIKDGEFSTPKTKSTLPTSPITSFAEDGQGRLFFSTLGEGVFYFQDNNINKINSTKGLSDDYCYKLLLLPDGRLSVATDQGINLIKFTGAEYTIDIISSGQGLPDNIVRDVMLYDENRIWIGLQDKGFCVLDLKSTKITIPEASKNWPYGQVNSLLKLEESIWIATENAGIIELDKHGTSYQILPSAKAGKNAAIKYLVSDSERQIWSISGSQLIKSTGEIWKQLKNTGSSPFSFIHCMLVDKRGNVWFSPDQQLFRATKQSDGSYKFKKYIVTDPEKLTDIVTLFQDEFENIWIGTLGEGVFILNPQTDKIQHPSNDPLFQNGNVIAIEYKAGKVLIGGFSGLHEFNVHYDKSSGYYECTASDETEFDSLLNSYIYAIHTDKLGRTWVGTDEKGLVMLFDHQIKSFSIDDGLPSMTILAIQSDENADIWIATQGGGISFFNGKFFDNISIKQGLSDLSPSSIIIDKNNRVLSVHSNGVDIYNSSTKTFEYYSSESGLGELNPDLNAVAAAPDGHIWIGTERGIFYYQPAPHGIWQQPKVSINKVLLFLEPYKQRNNVKFKYNQNNIALEFNAPWYTDPGRISYSYTLEGFSEKWQITRDRSVIYPRLPPGNYRFRIKSSLNENFNNASEATFQFEVKAPFWQLLWFRLLLAICILFMILLVIRRREHRLRKAEAEEKEKLGFRFETLRSQVNPHFLFNSFNTLITVIEEDPERAIEYVEQLSQFFRNIISYKDVDLIPLKEEIGILENYIQIQSKRYGTNLKFKSSINSFKTLNIFIPPLTLQLLTENAIKHNSISHETTLLIELFIEEKYIVVKNNINPKYTYEKSTGIGLQNIKNRYKILCKEEVKTKIDDVNFIVYVPIITKSTNENTDN